MPVNIFMNVRILLQNLRGVVIFFRETTFSSFTVNQSNPSEARP